MSTANDEFCFIEASFSDEFPCLKADDETAARFWRGERKQPSPDSAPYVFVNGGLYYQIENVITPMEGLFDVMVGAYSFYLSDAKYQQLKAMGLPGLVAHPMVYIDHHNKQHGNYWCVLVRHKIDCLDIEASEQAPDSDDFDEDGIATFMYDSYSLCDKRLAQIADIDKKVFRMWGVSVGGTLIHRSLIPFFSSPAVRFVAVKDHI